MVDVFMMRAIRNALYLVLGLFLGGLSVLGFAADGTDAGLPQYQYSQPRWVTTGWTMPSQDTPTSSCNWGQNGSPYTSVKRSWSSHECMNGQWSTGLFVNATCSSGQLEQQSGEAMCRSSTQTCPQGSTLAAGKCTCTAGLVFFGGKCQAPKCTGTTPGPEMMFDIGTSPTGSPGSVRCMGGCLAVFEGSTPAATSVRDGVRRYYAKGRYVPVGDGSVDICTAGPSSPDTSTGSTPERPADSCPPGHGMVKIDGNVNCINASTGAGTAEPPQTDNKSTTRTQTTNPDNSTTVTTTTKNNITGGTTTVTETYAPGVSPGAGQPSGSSTVSTGGGSGGIGFGTGSGNGNGDGDGDKDACEDDPERVGCKHLDDILGEPVDGPDIGDTTETLTFTPVAGFGSGSYSCPPNPTMTLSLLGKSITAFDYAPACQFASGVRPVVIAFAALAAALIGLGVGRRD